MPGVGLCLVLGCGRCWVVPGETRVPPRTTPTTTAATTKQLAAFHSTSALKLTVNLILIPSKGWAWLYQVWVVAGKTRVPPRTTPTTTAAATRTKQLATFHSTSAHKLTVNTILLLRELLATTALFLDIDILKLVHNGSYTRNAAPRRAFLFLTLPFKCALHQLCTEVRPTCL